MPTSDTFVHRYRVGLFIALVSSCTAIADSWLIPSEQEKQELITLTRQCIGLHEEIVANSRGAKGGGWGNEEGIFTEPLDRWPDDTALLELHLRRSISQKPRIAIRLGGFSDIDRVAMLERDIFKKLVPKLSLPNVPSLRIGFWPNSINEEDRFLQWEKLFFRHGFFPLVMHTHFSNKAKPMTAEIFQRFTNSEYPQLEYAGKFYGVERFNNSFRTFTLFPLFMARSELRWRAECVRQVHVEGGLLKPLNEISLLSPAEKSYKDVFDSILANDRSWTDSIPVTEEWVIKQNHRDELVVNKPAQNTTSLPSAPTGSASGIALTRNGYVLARCEDVDGAKRVEIKWNGQTYPAKAVAADKGKGLVILKANGSFSPIRFQNPKDFRPGIPVFATGFQQGENGEVAVFRGTVSPDEIDARSRFSFTGNAIGIPGGPVINMKGELVGMVLSTEDSDDVFSESAGSATAISGASLIAFIRTCPECLKSISNGDLPIAINQEIAIEYAKRSTVLIVAY